MNEKKFIIEVGRLTAANQDGNAIAEIGIRTEPGSHGGSIRVWIPAKDSIAELNRDAMAEFKRFLRAAVAAIPD